MSKRNQGLNRAVPFAAGVLIGLSVVTPVFGATMEVEALQPLLLLGSLIVLLIGLIMKAAATVKPTKHSGSRESPTMNPSDLRWRETDPATDVALPRLMRADAMH